MLSGADPEKGAFLNPILLYCDQPTRHAEVHEIEAFGPVSTLMPYDTTEEAIELAKRGEGSLVGSIFTYDDGFAREMVMGTAAYHGRLLLANRDCAKEFDGSRLAVAGPRPWRSRPRRRGRGDGRRTRRFALHAAHGLAGLADDADRCCRPLDTGRGTARHRNPPVPQASRGARARRCASLTGKRTVTLEDIEHFANFTGDIFYAHMDEAAAKANPFFDGRVAHGYLIVSIAAGLFVEPSPGPVLANYGVDNLRFMTPVYPGDDSAGGADMQAEDRARNRELRRGALGLHRHQPRRPVVAQYDVLTMVAKKPS